MRSHQEGVDQSWLHTNLQKKTVIECFGLLPALTETYFSESPSSNLPLYGKPVLVELATAESTEMEGCVANRNIVMTL